jgi:hypothetical protein
VTGDELFVDYGIETAKRLLPNTSSSAPQRINHFNEQHFYGDPRDEEVRTDVPRHSVEALSVVTLSIDAMIVEQNDVGASRIVRQPYNSKSFHFFSH